MKGVIVQVGEPKSIVLFNNGKITAIPTPADCRLGMVVAVKLNNTFKILAVTIGAALLVGTGIFIGLSLVKGKPDISPPVPVVEDDAAYGWQEGREKMQELKQKYSEH